GVLAIVRRSAACAGLPGRVSGALQSVAAALGVATGGRRRSAGARGGLCRRPRGADSAMANFGERRRGEVGRTDEWSGVRRRWAGPPVQISPHPCRRPGGLIAAPL